MDGKSYRRLDGRCKAMEAHDAIYGLSRVFPTDERFGLTAQIRRSALSVPSNIAEGYGRHHRNDYLRHLYIARGSLMETETQLIAAVRQQMCEREEAAQAWDELQHTGRLLNGSLASLES